LRAAVSGSFRRHMTAITAAVYELDSRRVRVLSPADPRIVDARDEFLFVASDRVRNIRLVQDRHLEAIRSADFLWLVCPDGYVGTSASMELGYAAGAGVPIYTNHSPDDITLREYVSVVPSIDEAIRLADVHPQRNRPEGLLIDPHASIERARDLLDVIAAELERPSGYFDTALRVHRGTNEIANVIALPTLLH